MRLVLGGRRARRWSPCRQGLLPHGGELLTRLPGFQFLDSLAVDGEGNVCVATLGSGGITTVSPEDGSVVEFVEGGDLFVTNICFGGEDLRTAYITLSGAGKLAEVPWAAAGPGAGARCLSCAANVSKRSAKRLYAGQLPLAA